MALCPPDSYGGDERLAGTGWRDARPEDLASALRTTTQPADGATIVRAAAEIGKEME